MAMPDLLKGTVSVISSALREKMAMPDLPNLLKGTVSVISSDPPCKDGNARFTIRYTFIALFNLKYQLVIHVLVSLNCLFSFVVSLQK